MGDYTTLKKEIAERCPGLPLMENEPMSRHTTFKVGGPVPLMVQPRNLDEAYKCVSSAAENGVRTFFLGNGSNLLVSDQGADVFVIQTVGGMIGYRFDGLYFTVMSGCLCSHAATYAQLLNLKGLEFLYGIPGSLGGAVCMNAGAYGGEISQVASSVTVLEDAGYLSEIKDADFSYRHSSFSDGSKLIVSVGFALQKGNGIQIGEKMENLMEQRKEKQPLDMPSAGSTFKRPENGYAAELIDRCGLKGLTVGGAQVSEKHAGFIVNRGNATCRDILTLMGEVRQRVSEETGTELEPEVKLLGEEFPWSC